MNHIDKIDEYLIKYDKLIDRVFMLGGSPNHQDNTQLKMFFNLVDFKGKDIYLFAREDLSKIKPIFKKYCSYIKCGAYIPELKCDNNTKYGIKLATSNQIIYKKGIDY